MSQKREYYVIGRFTIAEQQEIIASSEEEALQKARESCGRSIDEYEEVDFEVVETLDLV